ncbi:hypothetical protein FHG87_008217 [Trinorchestia longiramus]|nr:hypothetical protein FHG87_008217 [Trinorchestia longiramus]
MGARKWDVVPTDDLVCSGSPTQMFSRKSFSLDETRTQRSSVDAPAPTDRIITGTVDADAGIYSSVPLKSVSCKQTKLAARGYSLPIRVPDKTLPIQESDVENLIADGVYCSNPLENSNIDDRTGRSMDAETSTHWETSKCAPESTSVPQSLYAGSVLFDVSRAEPLMVTEGSSEKIFPSSSDANSNKFKVVKLCQRFSSSLTLRSRSSSPVLSNAEADTPRALPSSLCSSATLSPVADKVRFSMWPKKSPKLSKTNPVTSQSQPNLKMLFKSPGPGPRKLLPPSSLTLQPALSDSKIIRELTANSNSLSLPNSPLTELSPKLRSNKKQSQEGGSPIVKQLFKHVKHNDEEASSQMTSCSSSKSKKKATRKRRKRAVLHSHIRDPPEYDLSSQETPSPEVSNKDTCKLSLPKTRGRHSLTCAKNLYLVDSMRESSVACECFGWKKHSLPCQKCSSEYKAWLEQTPRNSVESSLRYFKNEGLAIDVPQKQLCSCTSESFYRCVKCKCAHFDAQAVTPRSSIGYVTGKSISASSVVSRKVVSEENKEVMCQFVKPDKKIKNRSLSWKMEDVTRSVQEAMEKTITSPKSWRKSKLGEALFGPAPKLHYSPEQKRKTSFVVSDSEEEGRFWSFKLSRGKSSDTLGVKDPKVDDTVTAKPEKSSLRHSTKAFSSLPNTDEAFIQPVTELMSISGESKENLVSTNDTSEEISHQDDTRSKSEKDTEVRALDKPYLRMRKVSYPIPRSPPVMHDHRSREHVGAAAGSPEVLTDVDELSESRGSNFVRFFQRRRSFTQGAASLLKKNTDEDDKSTLLENVDEKPKSPDLCLTSSDLMSSKIGSVFGKISGIERSDSNLPDFYRSLGGENREDLFSADLVKPCHMKERGMMVSEVGSKPLESCGGRMSGMPEYEVELSSDSTTQSINFAPSVSSTNKFEAKLQIYLSSVMSTDAFKPGSPELRTASPTTVGDTNLFNSKNAHEKGPDSAVGGAAAETSETKDASMRSFGLTLEQTESEEINKTSGTEPIEQTVTEKLGNVNVRTRFSCPDTSVFADSPRRELKGMQPRSAAPASGVASSASDGVLLLGESANGAEGLQLGSGGVGGGYSEEVTLVLFKDDLDLKGKKHKLPKDFKVELVWSVCKQQPCGRPVSTNHLLHQQDTTCGRPACLVVTKFRDGGKSLKNEGVRGRPCTPDNEHLKTIVEQNSQRCVREMPQELCLYFNGVRPSEANC